METQKISNKINELRISRGLSYKLFGEKINVSESTARNFCLGNSLPDSLQIKTIVDLFEIKDLYEFLEIERPAGMVADSQAVAELSAELKQARFEADFYKKHCDEKITHIEKNIDRLSSSFDCLFNLLRIGKDTLEPQEEGSRKGGHDHARGLIRPKPKPKPVITHDP